MTPPTALTLRDLTDDAITDLAASSDLQHVTSLDLVNNKLKAPQLQTLLASPHLTQLTHLELGFNKQLGAAGAEVLAAWPGLTQLHTLDLAMTGLSNKGVDLLLRGPELPHLRTLNLQNNRLSLKAIQALTARRNVLHLTHLDLSRNDLDDACADLLARSHFDHLTHLDLSLTKLTDPGAQLLVSPTRPGLKALTYLSLDGCFRLSDEACANLNALAQPTITATN